MGIASFPQYGIIGPHRVTDYQLLGKDSKPSPQLFTGQCAVETPAGFRTIAVPYCYLDDFRILFFLCSKH